MANVTLNNVEMAVLKAAVRRGDSDEGFDELLNRLAGLLNERSGQMYLSRAALDEIQRYGLRSNRCTWHALLHGVFARSLGEGLGGDRDLTGDETRDGGDGGETSA